ncbi:uncharacterized protein LOC125240568 [Leguminivora glycinivorella]|uniref:uncharacterized protein LOC125240568 n=1 Tax=Leguminivora glycinivorella TaxID=1035111 RepID=UPI00200F5E67|nr:uncharacterized protein LOC125240568 [Leguminivora glycinivorella]
MCCCGQNGKNNSVPKKILPKADHKDIGDAMVDKISVEIKEHYRELARCVTAVNKMADTLAHRMASWPPARCEHERCALEYCYETQEHVEHCSNVVKKYVDCVRNILFMRIRCN